MRMTCSHMLITITALAKRFCAERTVIRLLASMNTLMIFQSVSAVETLATLITFITPLATMNKAMLIKDRSGKETLATNQAMIRALSSVALPYVVIEIWAYGELSATVLLLTDEGLHTCVSNEWMNECYTNHTQLAVKSTTHPGGSADVATSDWTVYTTFRKYRTGIDAFGALPTRCHCGAVLFHASFCWDASPRSAAESRARTRSWWHKTRTAVAVSYRSRWAAESSDSCCICGPIEIKRLTFAQWYCQLKNLPMFLQQLHIGELELTHVADKGTTRRGLQTL